MSLMYRTSIRSRRIKGCLLKPFADSQRHCPIRLNRRFSTLLVMRRSAVAEEAVKIPQSETTPIDKKNYPPKITTIVDQIAQLNLLEVADLNELLKSRLKIRLVNSHITTRERKLGGNQYKSPAGRN